VIRGDDVCTFLECMKIMKHYGMLKAISIAINAGNEE
jgi:hypothetical protein